MKTSVIIFRTVGFTCVLFTVFHLFFHKLFHWEQTLNCLSVFDRGIMLTYHYISILILAFMAWVSLIQPKDLLQSKMKNSILIFFTMFFTIRIITEFTLFGINPLTPVILISCMIPLAGFLFPVFKSYNK